MSIQRRRRKIIQNITIKKSIQTDYITEDDIAQWIHNSDGLVMSRKIHNQTEVDFSIVKIVCLTGYKKIIDNFYKNYIDKINAPFNLILIESDVICLTSEQIEHPKINQIFMWNKNINHKKIKALPIGLNKDRHTNLINNKFDPKEASKLLLINYDANSHSIRGKLLEKGRKDWANFCQIKNTLRLEKYYKIKSFADGTLGVGVTCKEYYPLIQDYKFVLSPRGGGEDCHRTWEALYMGRIPIVISSSIDELYQDLPVLVIKDWNEINEDFLNKKWEEFKNKKWNMEKLTLKYWLEKINGKKFHFITYSNHIFEKAKNRLLNEANIFGHFTSLKGYTPEYITSKFKEEYKDILSMNRGGGYWIWRFDVLKQEMEKLNKNDFLLYIDAGCQLNTKGKKRFTEYIDKLEKSDYGILSFQMDNQIEKNWTTKEIFNYYDISSDSEIGKTGQYLGGILLLKKNDHSLKFIDFMLETLQKNRYLFTDKYNDNQESYFKDNRHDQSVSSLYRKINGSEIIPRDETFYPQPFGCKESLKYPIWAKRKKD